jgi:hypothetical protein
MQSFRAIGEPHTCCQHAECMRSQLDVVARSRRVVDPCTLVLFGASGDLTQRMVMPAIVRLMRRGLLSPAWSRDHDEPIPPAGRADARFLNVAVPASWSAFSIHSCGTAEPLGEGGQRLGARKGCCGGEGGGQAHAIAPCERPPFRGHSTTRSRGFSCDVSMRAAVAGAVFQAKDASRAADEFAELTVHAQGNRRRGAITPANRQ